MRRLGNQYNRVFLDFKKSYGDFIRLMGAVPKDDYDDIVSKYETLETGT